jgi:cytochrome oxidase Cu insertion factor (SCO1/SenC/PrrC family)
MSGPTRGRRALLAIAAIFFLPLAAAVWLYYGSGWEPAPGAQHGKLLDPPRPLPAASLTLQGGAPAPADVLRGKWSIVQLVSGDCDALCVTIAGELRRVELALDKDAPRVRRVLLHAGGCCEGLAELAADRQLTVLGAGGEAGAAFLSGFPPARDGHPGVYIVDPHGNLVMSYPASGAARGLLKDLERLLRLSRIG